MRHASTLLEGVVTTLTLVRVFLCALHASSFAAESVYSLHVSPCAPGLLIIQ